MSTDWDRKTYFSTFLANFGGLAISVLSFMQFALSGYQTFVHHKSMIKTLYGESEDPESSDSDSDDDGEGKDGERVSRCTSLVLEKDTVGDAKKAFKKRIEIRQEFTMGYCTYLALSYLCCIRIGCCARRKCC